MTKAEYRRWLNARYPAKPGMASDPAYRKGERGRFGPLKRAYGDYLWHCDREMFEVEYIREGAADLPAPEGI